MKLLVTRHGQTPWGLENRICGRTDVPLPAGPGNQPECLLALGAGHGDCPDCQLGLRRALGG